MYNDINSKTVLLSNSFSSLEQKLPLPFQKLRDFEKSGKRLADRQNGRVPSLPYFMREHVEPKT